MAESSHRMERRIRLAWSPEHLRCWCQGASLPPAEERAPIQAPTGFLRMQRLMERIRQRRAARTLPPWTAAELEPPGPLPQPRRDEAPSACDADHLPSAGDEAR
jgi:hypothetical protein